MSKPSASIPSGMPPSRIWLGKIIQLQNEKLSSLCAAYPERFVAFASVALQHPELAAQQLEDGKKLGLRGAAIGGNVNGEEISSRRFDPFLGQSRGTRRA